MVSCAVYSKVKGKAKVEISTASATIVGNQVIRPICKRWKNKRKGKEGRQQRLDSWKGDGQTVKVGTHQATAGSNKDQQE